MLRKLVVVICLVSTAVVLIYGVHYRRLQLRNMAELTAEIKHQKDMLVAQNSARLITGVWPFMPKWLMEENKIKEGKKDIMMLRLYPPPWRGVSLSISPTHRYRKQFEELIEGKQASFIFLGLCDNDDSQVNNPAAYLAPDCPEARAELTEQFSKW